MGAGTQWVIWPGKAKLTHQLFDAPAWRVRTFSDNVIRSLRVALGRHRFSLVLARPRAVRSN